MQSFVMFLRFFFSRVTALFAGCLVLADILAGSFLRQHDLTRFISANTIGIVGLAQVLLLLAFAIRKTVLAERHIDKIGKKSAEEVQSFLLSIEARKSNRRKAPRKRNRVI